MSASAKRIRTTSSSGTVLPFPISSEGSTDTFDERRASVAIERAINAAMSTIDIRAAIENAVNRALQESLWFDGLEDDPLDAVYISELEMDQISRRDIEKLKALSTITDLSDEIQFPDD